ncbi:acid phosphatase [Rhodococcus sp. NPDC058521]|uniref:acid phosphatase n=1 Tax=Rhodococcus sp. NPDC058521 TaxID=3346536 RepID=UPI003661E31D
MSASETSDAETSDAAAVSDSERNPRIVLLRHGQTEWSELGKHTGRTDIPLSEVGEMQARRVASLVDTLGLRAPLIVSSPRLRAHRTAGLAGLRVNRTWDALAEWDYGKYEGRTTPEIRESVPDWTVWTHPCPGGESAEDIHSRCDLVLSVAQSQLAEHDVVLVGHGHFSRALISRWIDLPVSEGRRFALSPAGLSILGFEHGARQVISHNIVRQEELA